MAIIGDEDLAAFPLFFYDGEALYDMGDFAVHSRLPFKEFRAQVRQGIPVSPHRISIYFDSPKKSRSDQEQRRRRTPINSKFKFSSVLRRENSFFLVEMSPSRRDRRRRQSRTIIHGNLDLPERFLPEESPLEFPPRILGSPVKHPLRDLYQERFLPENIDLSAKILPDNLDLLEEFLPDNLVSPVDSLPEYLDVDFAPSSLDPPQSLSHAIRPISPFSGYFPTPSDPFSPAATATTMEEALCEECCTAEEEGTAAQFHCCLNDAVVVGFRTIAGPIARPVKSSG